jgi:hypothetical protein
VEDKNDASGGNPVARWQRTMGEGSDMRIQAYFDRTNRQDEELGETRDTFDIDFIQHARIDGDQSTSRRNGIMAPAGKLAPASSHTPTAALCRPQ